MKTSKNENSTSGNTTVEPSKKAPEARSNFIRAMIERDLASNKHGGRVATRFPPEPNGYLHIGHAKSICLNFGLARDYNGECHLRFDDTNPTKEEVEYVESIKEDVRWLGFDWGEHLYFASDYFEKMYESAITLIKKGKAYICDLPKEDFAAYRGNLREVGSDTPGRARSIEENLSLFKRMRAGEFSNGAMVLRARGDMTSPNMLMRDPVLYRILHATHHRTGDDWCLYPMYDFAHCLEDAIENITHSICTLEFDNNRELYDWVIRESDAPSTPEQTEFARLNLGYTVMSKRKLLELITDGLVSGWDDPRLPTIAGLRRRGVTPAAIRDFAEMIGVARTNSRVDIEKFEFCIRGDLNHKAPRVFCVLDPLRVVITNYPEGETEWLDASLFPHDVPKEGSRKVPFSRELYIEREDFSENPPKKWRRMAPGVEVRLRYGYLVRCEEVIKDENGEVVELRCTYDPETRGGSAPDGRKVKGTLHWVAADEAKPVEVRIYERLFNVEDPHGDPERSFKELLNPKSLKILKGSFIEPYAAEATDETHFQFERQGYFCRDSVDSKEGALVFNRVVALRDSWAKISGKKASGRPVAAPVVRKVKTRERPQRSSKAYEREKLRTSSPKLTAYYKRFTTELGLSAVDADVLAGDLALCVFFETSLKHFEHVKAVSRWILNELLHALKDVPLDSLPFDAEMFATLVKLVEDGKISNSAGKEVLAEMIKKGTAPAKIITDLKLAQVSDEDALESIVDAVLAANPKESARLLGGERKLIGFFMGLTMRASKGQANPGKVKKLLFEKIG